LRLDPIDPPSPLHGSGDQIHDRRRRLLPKPESARPRSGARSPGHRQAERPPPAYAPAPESAACSQDLKTSGKHVEGVDHPGGFSPHTFLLCSGENPATASTRCRLETEPLPDGACRELATAPPLSCVVRKLGCHRPHKGPRKGDSRPPAVALKAVSKSLSEMMRGPGLFGSYHVPDGGSSRSAAAVQRGGERGGTSDPSKGRSGGGADGGHADRSRNAIESEGDGQCMSFTTKGDLERSSPRSRRGQLGGWTPLPAALLHARIRFAGLEWSG